MKILNEEYSLEDIFKQLTHLNKLLDYPGYLIYKIQNKINNKVYIGDTYINIRNRFVTNTQSHLNHVKSGTSKHLYNSIRKYGLDKFTVEIVSIDATDSESSYISLYDSYTNGYNGNTSGIHSKSSRRNPNVPKSTRVFITKGKQRKFVKPNNLNYFLNLGWSKSKYNKPIVRINKYNKEKIIYEKDLYSYIGLGWNRGSLPRSSTLGRIRINDGLVSKLVSPKEAIHYLIDGWKEGRHDYNAPTSGTKWINNGLISKMIPSSDEIPSGYKKGRGSRWMNNGSKCLNVNISEIKSYEDKGWAYGRI